MEVWGQIILWSPCPMWFLPAEQIALRKPDLFQRTLSEVSHSSDITLTMLYWLSISDGLCWYLRAKTQLTPWTRGCIWRWFIEIHAVEERSLCGKTSARSFSTFMLSTGVCWQLGALTPGKTAPPCWQSPLMVTDKVWSAERKDTPLMFGR